MREKNEAAINPPMGWNSWDCYGAGVDEATLKANADYMAKNLKEYGWEYIVCDIQWYAPTASSTAYENFCDICLDAYGRAVPAVNRFPSAADGKGFKPIADYIHGLGLKFGIHIMRGIPRQAVSQNLPVKGSPYTARQIAHPASICAWNTDMYGVDASKPGAQEYYDSILELYASWGVDFIKADDICVKYGIAGDESTISYGREEIEMLKRAIDRCGKNIVLSLSPGPAMVSEAEHLRRHANMWRITNDFWDDWRTVMEMFRRCDDWAPYVSEGCFPDCDMLPFGQLSVGDVPPEGRRSNFTVEEARTVMTLWCLFRSPLFIGSELRGLDAQTLALLTNTEVLALLKNSRKAHQAKRVGDLIVWTAEDKKGKSHYAALFNTSWKDEVYPFDVADLDLEGSFIVHDLWKQADVGVTDGRMKVRIPKHGAVLFELKKAFNA